MNLKTEQNKKKLTSKARKGFRGYPVATIAYYGPTDKVASKVTVGIIAEESADPEPLNSWYSDNDVRKDARILEELLVFIAKYNAKSVVMVDKIIGCPHQEGIDYPDGDKCPVCTFWKNRDRWTGESIH